MAQVHTKYLLRHADSNKDYSTRTSLRLQEEVKPSAARVSLSPVFRAAIENEEVDNEIGAIVRRSELSTT